MRIYLAEGATGAFPFLVDRSKPLVSESRPNGGGSLTRIPGRFSVCDCINGNKRRYRKPVWEKNLQSGSLLQESIRRNAAFGLLEHPKDGIVTLLSPISHHVTKAEMVESKDPKTGQPVWEVVGEITVLDTPEGNKLKALIEGGYNPLVSSRGYGSLQRAEDGVDDVCEDYVCESWDVVIKPSFEQAELTPNRSDTTAKLAQAYQPDPQAESAAKTVEKQIDEDFNKAAIRVFPDLDPKGLTTDQCREVYIRLIKEAAKPAIPAKQALKESMPSTGSAKPTSDTKPSTNIMELNEIKTRIEALRSQDPAKPKRFAESMTEVESLHNSVAEWSAADPKRSWEAQKLHKELEKISDTFTETIKEPAKQAKRLSEQNTKLMRVINAVAKTALTYKNRLGESLKNGGEKQNLAEELTRRGQGWKRVAEQRQSKLDQVTKDWSDSCEALALISKRYHEDTTDLGRRLLVLEFKDKTSDPRIQKMLKEATRLRHIATIREMLEGKRPLPQVSEEEGKKAAGVGKPADGESATMAKKEGDKKEGEGECVAPEPGKVTNESKASAPKDEAGKKPEGVSEAKLVTSARDPRSVIESVDLVKRLSTAAA